MLSANTTGSKPNPQDITDDDRQLLHSVSGRFATVVGSNDGLGVPLFTTDTTGLWEMFIQALPTPELRSTYNCNACRRFVERFGGLVSVDAAGTQRSALWSDGPGDFRNAVRHLADHVERQRITGVFISSETQWGTPVTGEWRHFAVTPPPAMVWRDRVKTAHERAAELREDYGVLRRSLTDYPASIMQNAHNLLTTGQLYRSEKCIGIAAWAIDLHEKLASRKHRLQNEATAWLAVATGPPGFCHLRTTVISTLLDDIVAGKPFAAIKRAFDTKMDPLAYQRPQAAPTSGNIARAEKLVESLGIKLALQRRFARIEEVDAIWRPKPAIEPAASSAGVFDHLKPKETLPPTTVEAPAATMTWVKFARTILPTAERIEALIPHERRSYLALVTAVDQTAPPIIQWDRDEQRNPFTWYVYSQGSNPRDWNLAPGEFVRLAAITLLPPYWYGAAGGEHHGQGVFFLMEGARDLRYQRGAGFFPELLRSDLREVRATLEAYAQSAVLPNGDEATACGLDLRAGSGRWNVVVRVTSSTGRASFKLDRWD